MKLLKAVYPVILVGLFCIGMALYYHFKPLPEPEGIGFNVLRDAINDSQNALVWGHLFLPATLFTLIFRFHKL